MAKFNRSPRPGAGLSATLKDWGLDADLLPMGFFAFALVSVLAPLAA